MNATIKFHKKAGKAEIYIDTRKKQLAPFRIHNKLVFPDETEFDFIHDSEQFLAVKKVVVGERSALGGFFGGGSITSDNSISSLFDGSRMQQATVQRGIDMTAFVIPSRIEPQKQLEPPKPEPKFESRYYFAGTDEEPFLVRMQDGIKAEFDKGEDEFYDALVPDHIKTLSELYSVPWRRQGDIFGVPVPGLSYWADNVGARRGDSILGTRHTAKKTAFITFNGLGLQEIVKGRITAPDHKDQKWKSWHVVGQTKFLHNPQQAD